MKFCIYYRVLFCDVQSDQALATFQKRVNFIAEGTSFHRRQCECISIILGEVLENDIHVCGVVQLQKTVKPMSLTYSRAVYGSVKHTVLTGATREPLQNVHDDVKLATIEGENLEHSTAQVTAKSELKLGKIIQPFYCSSGRSLN